MSNPSFKLKKLTLAIMACHFSQISFAEEPIENTIQLAPIVTTATRTEQNSFDLPIAIDVVDQKDIEDGQLQVQLSESLIRLPGITAQNRNNQAQDPVISSRGFGSRASFGVRGIRIYVDGIPLTMPDGQGQPGVVDLASIRSVEVMRGPFSALYGNSSGGVIQLLSKNAPKTPEIGGTVMYGSDNTKRQILNASGTSENIEYMLSTSNYETDGYRDHDKGQKEAATAKFKIHISDETKLTTLVNWFDQKAQDPGGLPRVATATDPSAFENPKAVVDAVNVANTRVERSHAQIGFNLEHSINENNDINLITYVGTRDNEQILATRSDGTNARNSQISREFYGADLRWDNHGLILDKAYTISLGINYGKSTDARLDTNILAGGVPISTLNRDEDNIVDNFDQYLQGKLSILDNVDIHAGIRHTNVNLEVNDYLITGTNPDNSGHVEYQKTTPVIGAVWKVTPTFNLYANYGKGFETPTFFEAAFDSTSSNAKPNLSLKPSESRNVEIGAKAFVTDNTQVNLNLFRITTENELVVSENDSGRSVYTNANDTKRTGAELSVDSQFGNNISTYFSYSLLNAKFDSDFVGTSGLIASGNRIPGTYKTQLYGEIAWKYTPWGFSTALEGSHHSQVYVDDINSDKASSYTIFNLRAGFEQNLAHWNFKEFVRVENLFDKEYIGSVKINDGNSRFYEPASDRNYLLGLSANYKF
jgi:iron complex outermembrane recepter protein